MKRLAAIVVSAASLVGCALVPIGDARQDATLKTFSVAPDRAGIFIYRNEIIGLAARMNVQLDGVPLGQTVGKTYLYREVAPGRHTITSSAENTDTLDLDVEAGSLAYVWQQVTWGMLAPRNKLHLVSEAQGRQGVLEARLVQSRSPTQAVEVRVAADDPAWAGPLDCQASNSFGNWPFAAPGTVTVAVSSSALQITCKLPIGAEAGSSITVPGAREAPGESARKGLSMGAAAGAGAGAALGAAAAPVMGPAFALLLTVGAALRGAEIGGIVGALTAGDSMGYPSPIVMRIRRASSPD